LLGRRYEDETKGTKTDADAADTITRTRRRTKCSTPQHSTARRDAVIARDAINGMMVMDETK